jgi:hypothetical protein
VLQSLLPVGQSSGAPLQQLKTITFVYDAREDRIRAAINSAAPEEAWSCWITRRLALAWLAKSGEFLTSTSALVQRAAPEHRGDLATFEREAAIAQTAPAMSATPPDVIKRPAVSSELMETVTWSQKGEHYQIEIRGNGGGGAKSVLTRAELQRITQMLQEVVGKATWTAASATPQSAAAPAQAPATPVRH